MPRSELVIPNNVLPKEVIAKAIAIFLTEKEAIELGDIRNIYYAPSIHFSDSEKTVLNALASQVRAAQVLEEERLPDARKTIESRLHDVIEANSTLHLQYSTIAECVHFSSIQHTELKNAMYQAMDEMSRCDTEEDKKYFFEHVDSDIFWAIFWQGDFSENDTLHNAIAELRQDIQKSTREQTISIALTNFTEISHAFLVPGFLESLLFGSFYKTMDLPTDAFRNDSGFIDSDNMAQLFSSPEKFALIQHAFKMSHSTYAFEIPSTLRIVLHAIYYLILFGALIASIIMNTGMEHMQFYQATMRTGARFSRSDPHWLCDDSNTLSDIVYQNAHYNLTSVCIPPKSISLLSSMACDSNEIIASAQNNAALFDITCIDNSALAVTTVFFAGLVAISLLPQLLMTARCLFYHVTDYLFPDEQDTCLTSKKQHSAISNVMFFGKYFGQSGVQADEIDETQQWDSIILGSNPLAGAIP